MTQRQESSRGSHKRAVQGLMDLAATFVVPEAKQERILDDIYTLFDDDFTPTIKAIRDWVYESSEALKSYFMRPSKQAEILEKKVGFIDGIEYLTTILLSELIVDHGRHLEELIMEDLAPLVTDNIKDD